MKVGKAGAALRQRVNVRRGDLAAESADVAEAPVVGYQQHDVGTRRRFRGCGGAQPG